jgi:putative membrane protein
MMLSDAPVEPDPAPAPPATIAPENRPGAAGPQERLHPFTLVFAVWGVIRWAIGPIIGLTLFGGGPAAMMSTPFVYLAVVAVLVPALVRYFTFTYRSEGGDLVIREGVFERTERHIPFERIQDLRTEQGFLHRLLGVTDVQIQTAGGEGPEASLSVLSLAEADRLRLRIAERARHPARGEVEEAHAPEPAAREIVRALRGGELVLAGLTSNRLAPGLALLGATWAFADDVLPDGVYERVAELVLGAGREVVNQGPQKAVLLGLVGLALFTLLGAVVSAVGSVVLFHGFTLSRSGEGLLREYGLITRRSLSLQRRRIQVLEIEQGIVRRLFGLATLRADTASGHGESQEDNGGRDVLLPAIPRGEADALLPIFFPDIDPGSPEWRPVSRRAIARATVMTTLFGFVVTGAALWYLGTPAGLWALALVPVLYGINVRQYRGFGYALGERYLRIRSGWAGRSIHVVPIRNIQTVVVRQGPLDRRLGLAALVVDTAGQRFTSGAPRIGNLPLGEAESLARTLARRAAHTRFRL